MFKKTLQSPFFTIPLVVIVGYLLMSLLQILGPVITAGRERRNLEAKLKEAKLEITRLEQNKEYLESNAYLEQQARLKLNFKKPGESVVIVYQKKEQGQNVNDQENSITYKIEKENISIRFLVFLKNIFAGVVQR